MSREGLMDDSGYNFEPSEAEQQAWNEGYLQGKAEAQEQCERCVYSGWKEQIKKHDAEVRAKAINEFAEWLCNKYEVFEPEDDGYTLYGDMKYHSKEELLDEFCIGDKCDDCVNHPMYIRGKADGREEHGKECDRCQYSFRKEVIEEVREDAIDEFRAKVSKDIEYFTENLKSQIYDLVLEVEKFAERMKSND